MISRLRKLAQTRPATHRIEFYSFLAKRALGSGVSEVAKDVIVEFEDVKFLFPAGFRWSQLAYSLYMRESEQRTFDYMTSLNGTVAVDVGANIGGYSIRLAKSFERVIAIEPNPGAADLLRRNIRLNGVGNVEVLELAASDRSGVGTLNLPSGHEALSSTVRVYSQGRSLSVRLEPLDTLLQGYEEIDLMKIDVEGAEPEVLKGAKESLRKTTSVVAEVNSASTLEILRDSGFELSDLGQSIPRNVLAKRTPLVRTT